MELKKIYEQELEYLRKILTRSKSELSQNGLVNYKYDGMTRKAEVSPKLDAYNKILTMYLKTMKEYTDFCGKMHSE